MIICFMCENVYNMTLVHHIILHIIYVFVTFG